MLIIRPLKNYSVAVCWYWTRSVCVCVAIAATWADLEIRMHTGLSVVATQWPVDIFSNLKLHLWSPVKKRARLLTREYSCDSRNNFGSFFICLQRITIIVCFDRFSVECAKLLECSKKVRFEQSGNDHMSYTRVLICTWRKTEKLILNIV